MFFISWNNFDFFYFVTIFIHIFCVVIIGLCFSRLKFLTLPLGGPLDDRKQIRFFSRPKL